MPCCSLGACSDEAGLGSGQVSATVYLRDHDFAGTLELSSGWTTENMGLFLSWNSEKSMIGVMQTNAELEAQMPADPDAKSGIYAVIVANG